MLDWSRPGSMIDFCAIYFTTQLVRCAAFSFLWIGLVTLLRKTLFLRQTFLRGMLWASFVMVPFLGRLRLYYENEAVNRATGWLTRGTMFCLWADRIYVAGILTAAFCIFGKRLRLRRNMIGADTVILDNVQIFVTDLNITPFTVGLLRPRIVLPKAMLDRYGREELEVIIQHEQTHIRLWHLWYGFLWDLLRCLLWVNPFLSVCQKHFRADMEDICDRVCIQNGQRSAQEYGRILLKSLRLLNSCQEDIPHAATYAGERNFADMKRRMEKIADFRPYQKRLSAGTITAVFLLIGMMILVIHTHSYARCNESADLMVYEYDGEANLISDDTEDLSGMISYDDSYVYVDGEAFEDFLEQNHAQGEVYIVFGGYYKLPGLGDVAQSCSYENDSKEKAVTIPYESITEQWDFALYQWL